MEYQALYRKYRPKTFKDVVAQHEILTILLNSLKAGKISHAYLFSGPRGTGKTTVAKILAKTINCLNIQEDFSPCFSCENCLDILNNSSDIIEIDAASNNGVDEIRELKSKINLVPGKLKYKIYIIDEVHMLSTSAFNALLKTLEEPPGHVIFILATTEFYKVPETIVSRCQCLNFTRIQTEDLVRRLEEIASKENISITNEAIKAISEYAEGGMRDALGMLDKLASYSLENITVDDFFKINGLISKKDMEELIKLILNHQEQEVIKTLLKFDSLGYDFPKLIERLMQQIRDEMVSIATNKKEDQDLLPKLYELIFCLNDTYLLLKEAVNRRIIVEVQLLKFMNKDQFVKKIDKSNDISQEIKKENTNEIKPSFNLGNKKYQIDLEVKNQRINNTFAMASKLLKNIAIENFRKINDYLISPDYKEVSGLLKDCYVGVVSDTNIILVTKYQSILEGIYQKFSKVNDLINIIFEKEMCIVILLEEEFTQEIEEFKKHLKDKDFYKYKKETKPFYITLEPIVEKERKVCYGNLVEKALDVFGQDIVEIE